MAPITSLSVVDVASCVVWLRGEHDLSTVPELSAALTRAITLDDSDVVVVDLADLQFLDAAIVGVFLRCRELLRAQSRCLVLRSPPRCVRRVLELCDSGVLLAPAEAAPDTRAAPHRHHDLRGAGSIPALVSSVVVGHRGDGLAEAVAGRGTP